MSKMLKSGPILILCHWHTGSSIIANILAACGMKTGNAETFWDEYCETPCEHSLLNRIGDQITLGNNMARWPALIEETLLNYVKQAKKNKWKHYGVKFTHGLHVESFKIFAPIIKKIWPKARIIIPIRHPVEIIASTKGDDWPEERVMESIRSTYLATEKLVKAGAVTIVFPDDIQKLWKKIVPDLGLKATGKAKKLFDNDKVEVIDHKQRAAFAETYPEDADWFERMKNA